MSRVSKKSKVMPLSDAVSRFVFDGAVVGVGGQNISRCPMAITHEMVRQGKKDLTLVGCNLSIHMDILVGAGLVRRCECGSGNLERFGTTFQFRKAIENGRIEVEDYDHLAMTSRFLAGEMGIPFIPVRSMLGSDMLKHTAPSTQKKYHMMDNPWNAGEKTLLLLALNPDVSIIHVQKADETGNVIIEGIQNHEPEMVRASKATIVTCEEIVTTEEIRRDADRTTIPYHFIDAVIEQPLGAYPTATYRYYSYDADHIRLYQDASRKGGDDYRRYLEKYVYVCRNFEEYLEKAAGLERLGQLKKEMNHLH